MVKVFIIIGLFLAIAGVPGLYWCSFQNDQQQQQITACKAKYKHQVDDYVQKLTGSSLKATDTNAIDVATAAPNPEKMKPSERTQYQQERLLADIDELAEATIPTPPNANVVYGENWRQKVADYKDKKQSRTTIQVASVTGMIAGGVLFVAAMIFAFFRVMAAGIGWVVKGFRKKDTQEIPNQQSRPIQQERIAAPVAAAVNSPSPAAKPSGPTAEEFRKQLVAQTENLKETVDQLKNLAGDLEKQAAEHDANLARRLEKGFKIQHASFKHENDLLKKSQEIAQSAHEDMVRLFGEELNNVRRQIEELNKAVGASVSQKAEPADLSAQLEKSLQMQMELLKKEIEPLKNTIAETIHSQGQATPDHAANPVNTDAVSKNLSDLTEQVCAIREYAAKQQQRLAKLQDGYDWNIIKNFCLRVIRCIDNLDDRIGELSANGGSVEHLLPVREELVFILESNGIERFGAKVNSDYRGQEIRVQVLNEREETEDTELIGRIAHVLRPGYQCRVNDEYTKIVRPAQVRLYGPCLNDVAVRGS
jgi:hypothetical protein